MIMSETKTEKTETNQTAEKQPGLFGRIFKKLDASMKQKADANSQQGCCGGDDDGKGGKCC
jgi:hypothetical protein